MHSFSTRFARNSTLVLLSAAAAGCATTSGGIPSSKESATARPRPASTPQTQNAVEAVSLAAQLADYGQRTNSGLALAAAAQLLLDNPTRPLSLVPESDKAGAPGPRPQKAGAQASLDVGQLLASAQAAGRDNANLTLVVAQLQQRNASGSRGAVNGPKSGVFDVDANSTDTFRIAFEGGVLASIRVNGDGDTDLDCWVYDQNGRVVARDVDDTDFCVLDWYPRTTSTHRLVIKNWDDVYYNRYRLTTN